MDATMIFWIIAAFGSGAFATAIGGVESFCITGVFALIGTCLALAGAGDLGGLVTGNIAFGMFGPHIAFAGAVAGAAYAKKAGKLENGADIVTPISSCNDPMALVVGGIFGVIGYLFKAFVVDKLFAGTISLNLATDGPGFTVFCSAILVRLIFGGKIKTGQAIKSEGAAWTTMLTMGITFSLMTSGIAVALLETARGAENVALESAILNNFPVTCFGIAAIGLIFACGGLAFYGCHQILLISALAACKAYPTVGAIPAIIIGVIFGTIAAIINDSETVFANSGDVNHIDGPATAIFITTFIINAIWGSSFAAHIDKLAKAIEAAAK